MTIIHNGHLLYLDPALVEAFLRQALKGDLGPSERQVGEKLLGFLREAEREERVLVALLDGGTWGTHPILLSLTLEELETFDPE